MLIFQQYSLHFQESFRKYKHKNLKEGKNEKFSDYEIFKKTFADYYGFLCFGNLRNKLQTQKFEKNNLWTILW